jgi:hypothetical protein
LGRLVSADLSGINADLAKRPCEARSIADQAAGSGELTPFIERRDGVAGCQRHELLVPGAEERIGFDDEPAGVPAFRIRSCSPFAQAAFCMSLMTPSL